LGDFDDIIVRFMFLKSEETVWKYPYICKMLKEIESKYIVMDTGWKALPVGRNYKLNAYRYGNIIRNNLYAFRFELFIILKQNGVFRQLHH